MTNQRSFTAHERRATVRYLVEFGIGMALFLILFLMLPQWWVAQPGTPEHLVQTLVPALPLLWLVVALWRHYRRADEMQREVFLRSFSFGFAVTTMSTVIVGLMRGSGIELNGGEWIIFVAGMTAWGVALPVNFAMSRR